VCVFGKEAAKRLAECDSNNNSRSSGVCGLPRSTVMIWCATQAFEADEACWWCDDGTPQVPALPRAVVCLPHMSRVMAGDFAVSAHGS
jgi:hypothetical protein